MKAVLIEKNIVMNSHIKNFSNFYSPRNYKKKNKLNPKLAEKGNNKYDSGEMNRKTIESAEQKVGYFWKDPTKLTNP